MQRITYFKYSVIETSGFYLVHTSSNAKLALPLERTDYNRDYRVIDVIGLFYRHLASKCQRLNVSTAN